MLFHIRMEKKVPDTAFWVGALLPSLGATKRWLVRQVGYQWLVLRLQTNGLDYQIRGIFFKEPDARLFKRVIKKQSKGR